MSQFATLNVALADQILALLTEEDISFSSFSIAKQLHQEVSDIDDAPRLMHMHNSHLFELQSNNSGHLFASVEETNLERIRKLKKAWGFTQIGLDQAQRAREAEATAAATAAAEFEKRDLEFGALRRQADAAAVDSEKRDFEIAALRRQAIDAPLAKRLSIAAVIIAPPALVKDFF